MPVVIVQNWEESERGWGIHPDGFTIHISMEQRAKYVEWFYKEFNNLPYAPDEYTRTSGDPFPVDVPIAVYNKIAAAALKKVNGRITYAAHGKGRYFSKGGSLKKEDIV